MAYCLQERSWGPRHERETLEWQDFTTLGIARETNHTEAVLLLEKFMANPAQTRHQLRVKLGVLDELAAEIFALVIFLCDDLLQLKPALAIAATDAITATNVTRFFIIIRRLPMELQMLLCHRAVSSRKQNITKTESEAAFRSLARILN